MRGRSRLPRWLRGAGRAAERLAGHTEPWRIDVNYATLTLAVNAHAALRRRQRLQPVGGKGDKIFPPTYPEERRGAGPRHVFERRRIDGAEVWCVLARQRPKPGQPA